MSEEWIGASVIPPWFEGFIEDIRKHYPEDWEKVAMKTILELDIDVNNRINSIVGKYYVDEGQLHRIKIPKIGYNDEMYLIKNESTGLFSVDRSGSEGQRVFKQYEIDAMYDKYNMDGILKEPANPLRGKPKLISSSPVSKSPLLDNEFIYSEKDKFGLKVRLIEDSEVNTPMYLGCSFSDEDWDIVGISNTKYQTKFNIFELNKLSYKYNLDAFELISFGRVGFYYEKYN